MKFLDFKFNTISAYKNFNKLLESMYLLNIKYHLTFLESNLMNFTLYIQLLNIVIFILLIFSSHLNMFSF